MALATLFERVGGTDFFVRLVDSFYDRVVQEPVLRTMYPTDLVEPKRHLALFLAQYWGGPPEYQELRGHPRLRMRHSPFAINADARDAWLDAMQGALNDVAVDVSAMDRAELDEYFAMAAQQLRNL